ncbi:glycoside hydrolase family 32 protein [bacterium]|nr:glycoside hydrolase family 32 protein [bacterium]
MNALHRDLKRLVDRVEAADAPRVAADPHRQRYHIQPAVGWLNDPNGLCKIGQDYHVFYQYGPFDPNGGVKHWGHLRSRDLLHWERLPVMLYPDAPYDCHGVYSGSALWEEGTLFLYYTGNVKYAGDYDYIRAGRGHNLCLATSRDGVTLDTKQCLMTNADYPAGLSCHVRDPKVWKQDGRYYMVLGARTLEDRGEVLVLQSTDRLHWTHINTLTTREPFGYMWECPDLFELGGQWYLAVSPQGIDCPNVYGCGYFPVYGDWRGEYTLGDFHPLDMGYDFYAPQSFADGDRRLQFGWMAMPDAPYTTPDAAFGWNHCLTVPRVLTAGPGGTLRQNPAPELAALRSPAALSLSGGETVSGPASFDLTAAPQGDFTLTLAGGLQLRYEEAARTCTLRFTDPAIAYGRSGERSARLTAPCRSLRVLGDASSVEIFLNDGATVFTTRYFPAPGPRPIRLDGAAGLLYQLNGEE